MYKNKMFCQAFPSPLPPPFLWGAKVGRDVAQIQLIKRLLCEETGVAAIRDSTLTQFYRRALRAHH